MKHIICALLACLLLFSMALAGERDASGVAEKEGRLAGTVTGLNEQSGKMEPALWVDCECPGAFTDDQLAVLSTEWIELDERKLREAVSATGGAWRENAYERFDAYSAGGGAAALPADADAGEAKARAVEIAQAFVRGCGLGETRVIKALRPEEEARSHSMNVTPAEREAFIRRELKEWYFPDIRYTWVSLQFRLRGLPMAKDWTVDNLGCSSVANLYIGDAGEMREFCLFYAPREASAVPYTGTLKTWREALEDAASAFDCRQPQPARDERGRVIPASRFEISALSPGYASLEGRTWYPAWLMTVDCVEDESLRSPAVLEIAIDARKE